MLLYLPAHVYFHSHTPTHMTYDLRSPLGCCFCDRSFDSGLSRGRIGFDLFYWLRTCGAGGGSEGRAIARSLTGLPAAATSPLPTSAMAMTRCTSQNNPLVGPRAERSFANRCSVSKPCMMRRLKEVDRWVPAHSCRLSRQRQAGEILWVLVGVPGGDGAVDSVVKWRRAQCPCRPDEPHTPTINRSLARSLRRASIARCPAACVHTLRP